VTPSTPVFVVTGPSGAGKGTLIQLVLPRFPQLALAVSATTRPQRPGEENGAHYWFLDRDEFERKVLAGDFLEWVDYVGNRYGTLNSEIDRLRSAGKAPLLELETDGALRVKSRVPGAVTIFVTAPVEELERHREQRGDRRADRDRSEAARAAKRVRLHRAKRRPAARRRRPGGDCRPVARWCRYHGAAMIHPRIDELMDQVDSRYALVIVAAKRARQINNYHHQLGEGTFDEFAPPLIESRSKNYLTMALEETAEGKIAYDYKK
jgi:guanylate kinase/DNA-directed RNA polymerase omega subunit